MPSLLETKIRVIHGIKIARNPLKLIIYFVANDSIIFCTATQNGAIQITNILQLDQKASDQFIHLDKKIYPSVEMFNYVFGSHHWCGNI